MIESRQKSRGGLERRGLMKKRKSKKVVKRAGRRGAVNRVKWGRVDWDMQDVAIAREFGCSRERVRQKRIEVGVGQSPLWHRRPGCARDRIAAMDTEGKTLEEIALGAGCKKGYAMQCVSRQGKSYVAGDRGGNRKYDWSKADWCMTDDQVAVALGVANPGVVSQYRFRHGIWKRGAKANVAVVAVKAGKS